MPYRGWDAAKASTIFAATEECFVVDDMLWNNCVSLSVDNTNAMIDIRISVTSKFLGKNNEMCNATQQCISSGTITTGHANDGFSNYINLNTEDVCVNDFLFV